MKRNKLTNIALSIGGRIHPLMGHLYSWKPRAELNTSACSMCATAGTVKLADTSVPTSTRQTDRICIEHDLFLHRAIHENTYQIIDEYRAEVLAGILRGVVKPRWIPNRIYARLVSNANQVANKLAHVTVTDLITSIFDRHAAEQDALADRLFAQIEAQRAQNTISSENGD